MLPVKCMSNEHHHTEFEHWLREETDRHRLYADESVWERIQNRLRRRRWLPFVLSALGIISASVTWVMIDQPDLPINYASNNNFLPVERSVSQTPSVRTEKDPLKIATPYKASLLKQETSAPSFLMPGVAEQPSTIHPSAYTAEIPRTTESAEILLLEAKGLIRAVPLKAIVVSPTVYSTPTIPTTDLTLARTEGDQSLSSQPEVEKQKEASPVTLIPEQYQTIESVISNYKGKRTRKSWKVQLSMSPTISYRQLIENKEALQAARSVMSPAPALAAPELETVVNHKPDLGLQFGLLANRALTKRIDFVGGLQFNINKYDIQVYRGGQEVATVGLSNGVGAGSVSSYTNYRSSGGIWANWLANFYFSVSAPVGFQYRVAGNKKWSWSIGSSIQPTYLLSNQAYVLSTDYKNYLEVPSLVRRWNLNGQVESFIGFQNGKTRWTLGPQARYQILSSYEKAYPVREHLFDVGIKLGIGL